MGLPELFLGFMGAWPLGVGSWELIPRRCRGAEGDFEYEYEYGDEYGDGDERGVMELESGMAHGS
jgi:hypothetical protein